ncbi:hypothetical protein PGT21_013744 [Puccinia graminis f. sp. tritici]|uniref:Uncharacterized protein n=1 Tax=Puccinia graminis f. sp. tritici TaxID=56615 RepID=A0A5B0MBZ8_PUCGR|nr:hypothetical protein PGT21_013744 [Puccinia graminis f. sp. tritici]
MVPGLQSCQWLAISNELRGRFQADWSYWSPTSGKFQGSGGETPRLQVLLGSNFLQSWISRVSREWSKVWGKASRVEEKTGEDFSVVQLTRSTNSSLAHSSRVWSSDKEQYLAGQILRACSNSFCSFFIFADEFFYRVIGHISAGDNKHGNCEW